MVSGGRDGFVTNVVTEFTCLGKERGFHQALAAGVTDCLGQLANYVFESGGTGVYRRLHLGNFILVFYQAQFAQKFQHRWVVQR